MKLTLDSISPVIEYATENFGADANFPAVPIIRISSCDDCRHKGFAAFIYSRITFFANLADDPAEITGRDEQSNGRRQVKFEACESATRDA